MIVTCSNGGTAEGSINYLLYKERDVAPKILRGSEIETIMIDETLGKYATRNEELRTVNIVLSFAPKEKITEEQKQYLLDQFDKYMLREMGGRLNYIAVEHNEKDHYHIHILLNKVDLDTGNAFNPLPPLERTKQLIKNFSALMNYEFGFEQVKEDPLKKSLKSAEVKALKNGANGFKTLPNKEELDKKLQKLVKLGVLRNRNDLLKYLKKEGIEVAKKSEDYISIKNEEGRNIRLKGGIYSRNDGKDYEVKIKEQKTKEVEFSIEKVKSTLVKVGNLIDHENHRLHRAKLPEHLKNVSRESLKIEQSSQKDFKALPQGSSPKMKEHTTTPEKVAQNVVKQDDLKADRLQSVATQQSSDEGDDRANDSEALSGSSGNESMSAQEAVNSAMTALANAKTPEAREKAKLRLASAKANLDKILASIEEGKKRFKIK